MGDYCSEYLRRMRDKLRHNEINGKETIISACEGREFANVLTKHLFFDTRENLITKNEELMRQVQWMQAEIARLRKDRGELVRGYWIEGRGSWSTANCSICGWQIPYSEDSRLDATNYCPNCGAKMNLTEWEFTDLNKKYQRKVSELEQVTRERDAAVADLKAIESTDDDDLNFCEYCRYGTGEECENPQCNPYDRKSGWEWRGVPQEVEHE